MNKVLSYIGRVWAQFLRFVKRLQGKPISLPNVNTWLPEFFYYSPKADPSMIARRVSVNQAIERRVRASGLLTASGIATRLPDVSRHIKGDFWNNAGFLAVGELTLPFVDTWRMVEIAPADFNIVADINPPEYPAGVPDVNVPFGTVQLFRNKLPVDMTQYVVSLDPDPENTLRVTALPGEVLLPGSWRLEVNEGNQYLRPVKSPRLNIDNSPIIAVSAVPYQDGAEEGYVFDLDGGPSLEPDAGKQRRIWVRFTYNTLDFDLPFVDIVAFDTAESLIPKAVAAWNGVSVYGAPPLQVYPDPTDPTKVRIVSDQITQLLNFEIIQTPPLPPPLVNGPQALTAQVYAYTVNNFFVIEFGGGPEVTPKTITLQWTGSSGYSSATTVYTTQVLQTAEQAGDAIEAAWDNQATDGIATINVIPFPTGERNKKILGAIDGVTAFISITIT